MRRSLRLQLHCLLRLQLRRSLRLQAAGQEFEFEDWPEEGHMQITDKARNQRDGTALSDLPARVIDLGVQVIGRTLAFLHKRFGLQVAHKLRSVSAVPMRH